MEARYGSVLEAAEGNESQATALEAGSLVDLERVRGKAQ